MPDKKRIRQLAAAIELASHDPHPIDAGYSKGSWKTASPTTSTC